MKCQLESVYETNKIKDVSQEISILDVRCRPSATLYGLQKVLTSVLHWMSIDDGDGLFLLKVCTKKPISNQYFKKIPELMSFPYSSVCPNECALKLHCERPSKCLRPPSFLDEGSFFNMDRTEVDWYLYFPTEAYFLEISPGV